MHAEAVSIAHTSSLSGAGQHAEHRGVAAAKSSTIDAIRKRRALRSGAGHTNSWLVSCLAHLGLVLVAALWSLPAYLANEIVIMASLDTADQSPAVEVVSMPATTTASVDAPSSASSIETLETSLTPGPTVQLAELGTPTSVGSNSFVPALADLDLLNKLARPIRVPGSGESSSTGGSRFFGTTAYGDDFVFVVDMSTSMRSTSYSGLTRFQVARAELLRSIEELTEKQRFCVIMFGYRTRFMFDLPPRLLRANHSNKRRLRQWVAGLEPISGTDPRFGVYHALRLRPDAVFVLSDGEFNGQDVNTHGIPGNPPIETIVAKFRPDGLPIHTIAFEDRRNRRRLRAISQATGGTHRFQGRLSPRGMVLADLRSDIPSDALYAMQQIIDGKVTLNLDQQIQAGMACSRLMRSSNAELRERALACQLTIADGSNFGPFPEDESQAAFRTASRDWMDYWAEQR